MWCVKITEICALSRKPNASCDYKMWEFIVFSYYDYLHVFLSGIKF
jgi:hypothetical protein